MKLANYTLLVVLSLVSASVHAATDAAASRHAEKRGLAIGLPAGGGPTIGGTYFLSSSRALRYDFGLDLAYRDAGGSTYGFSVDVGYRMYLWDRGPVAAFMQPEIFFAKGARAGNVGDLISFGVGDTLGAEYFFDPELSISASTGLSLAFSNAFKDLQVRTGTTALYANLYW